MKNHIKNFIKRHENLDHYAKVVYFNIFKNFTGFIDDISFLKIQYRLRTGTTLNLDKPTLYNEKIQWLKLNYKSDLLTQCVDKWAVRDYVKSKGLKHILIRAYGPFESLDNIDKSILPNQFIIKLTNGSGFNLICFDKNKFDFDMADRKFKKWKKINFYASRREWAYKNVKNRIMIEDLISGEDHSLPPDFRFFCFHGEVKFIAVDLNSVENGVKTSNYYRHLYSPQWRPIEARINYPKKPNFEVSKPDNLQDLIAIAERLSHDFPAVRIDLYNTDNGIRFGEITFYHASGYQNISPPSFHREIGSYLDLEKI